jgi:hypothetical protein
MYVIRRGNRGQQQQQIYLCIKFYKKWVGLHFGRFSPNSPDRTGAYRLKWTLPTAPRPHPPAHLPPLVSASSRGRGPTACPWTPVDAFERVSDSSPTSMFRILWNRNMSFFKVGTVINLKVYLHEHCFSCRVVTLVRQDTSARVARFFLVQHTKTEKIYHITTKCSKCPCIINQMAVKYQHLPL